MAPRAKSEAGESGWDEAFAAELAGRWRRSRRAAVRGRRKYAELLTYLELRSKDELEESALLTLLLGIAHSRLAVSRWASNGRWLLSCAPAR